MKRQLQIGVIGSMADLNYSDEIEQMAVQLGIGIAKAGCILVFGAEKDSDSLPTVAAMAARQAGGITLGVTYEKGLSVYKPEAASCVVATGLTRGGGREMVQALSCDGLIAIGGGSGTLNELCVAYQANIPVIVLEKTGGWSDKLAGTYLDERQRYIYGAASSPYEAVLLLQKMIKYEAI